MKIMSNLPARFWAKVDKSGPEGRHSQTGVGLGPCWNWTGSVDNTGYGRFMLGSWKRGTNRPHVAHRVSYEAQGIPIPDGLDIDHLCRNRRCVNPSHLEAVTRAVNLARGVGAAAASARGIAKTHCVRGHAFTVENTNHKQSEGYTKRACRTCNRDDSRERMRRVRAQAAE